MSRSIKQQLDRIREKHPEIKIRHADGIKDDLKKMEEKYGYSTEYMLNNKLDIDEDVVNRWISLYESYVLFNGYHEE